MRNTTHANTAHVGQTARRRAASPVRFAPTGGKRGVLSQANSPLLERWVREYWGTATSFSDATARVRAWELALDAEAAELTAEQQRHDGADLARTVSESEAIAIALVTQWPLHSFDLQALASDPWQPSGRYEDASRRSSWGGFWITEIGPVAVG